MGKQVEEAAKQLSQANADRLQSVQEIEVEENNQGGIR